MDGGYTGEAFAQWVKGRRPKLDIAVVKRADGIKGFKVLPRRWRGTHFWLAAAPPPGWFAITKPLKPVPKLGFASR